MKVKCILFTSLIAFFIHTTVHAQSKLVTDSLLNAMCRSIEENSVSNDTDRLNKAFSLHLNPVLATLNETEGEKTYEYAFIRLQKLCPEFKRTLDRIKPLSDGDWVPLKEKPLTTLNQETCRNFITHKKLFYRDDNGDTVRIAIEKNNWTETFKGGTFSKLKMNWLSDCEYELTFIESNNASRKSLSKPGDKYKYLLVKKHPGYYEVCLDIKEFEVLGIFKIYY